MFADLPSRLLILNLGVWSTQKLEYSLSALFNFYIKKYVKPCSCRLTLLITLCMIYF